MDSAKERGHDQELEMDEDDTPTLSLMRLVEEGGAFDFWMEEGEAIYSDLARPGKRSHGDLGDLPCPGERRGTDLRDLARRVER